MKILFSPSESKRSGGLNLGLSKENFTFSYLYEKRLEVLKHYHTLIQNGDPLMLQHLFGIKDESKIHSLASMNIFNAPSLKAIERYTGVAYEYLNYPSLDTSSQAYIDSHTLIFSNLFGPILASDLIPEYKLHQGESLNGFKAELFYKEHFSHAIDTWIGDESILDLRAGFYEKFYTCTSPYITMKFLKRGKVVSHFAKAYRGYVLREVARVQPKNEKELCDIPFEKLKIYEIKRQKLKQEYIYEIID